MPPKKKPPALGCVGGFRNSISLAAIDPEDNPQSLVLQSILRRYGLPGPLARIVAALVEVGKRVPV